MGRFEPQIKMKNVRLVNFVVTFNNWVEWSYSDSAVSSTAEESFGLCQGQETYLLLFQNCLCGPVNLPFS